NRVGLFLEEIDDAFAVRREDGAVEDGGFDVETRGFRARLQVPHLERAADPAGQRLGVVGRAGEAANFTGNDGPQRNLLGVFVEEIDLAVGGAAEDAAGVRSEGNCGGIAIELVDGGRIPGRNVPLNDGAIAGRDQSNPGAGDREADDG